MLQKFSKKTGLIVALIFVVGGTSIYFIQQAYPGGGFVRDLLAITIAGLVSSLFSFTLEKTARRKYLVKLSVMVALFLFTVCWVKLSLKSALAEAFGAVKLSVVKKGTPIDPSDGNFEHDTEAQQQWQEYWKNY